jgi:hypothetical protein
LKNWINRQGSEEGKDFLQRVSNKSECASLAATASFIAVYYPVAASDTPT